MTICFFSAQYLPTVGGVERYTYNLAKELVTKGNKVVIVTSALPNLPAQEVTEEGFVVYRLPVISFMNGRFPVIKNNKECRQLVKKLKQEKIQFCVIQTRFYINSIFGAYFAKNQKIPSLVIEHGSAHLMRDGLTGFLGNIYEHMAFWLIRRACADIYGVSKACCTWLEHFNVNTDKLLYNAIDPVQLEALITEKSLRDIEKYIPEDTQTIIYFSGRFIPEKGVVQLATAFKKLLQTHPKTILIMSGNGVLFNEIKNLKIINIVLLGEVDYRYCLACFKRADIFCLPTFSEGFATTILEAAMFENAILTTPTGGSPEIIISPEHGLLFETMQTDAIYNALLTAVNDHKWCVRAGKNAKKQLLESFTWDKVSDKLIEIISQKLGK